MRIVICEDHALLREGLIALLREAGHDVVAHTDTGTALLGAIAEHHPDLAIVDVRLPPSYRDEGIHAAIAARQQAPGLGILILSQYVEPVYTAELLDSGPGGIGYLLKERVGDVQDFLDALSRIAAGGTALDRDVVSQLLHGRSRDRSGLDALTPRERETLGLMAEGRSNAAIARALVVSLGAVEKNVSSIFTKLDLAATDDDHRRVLAVLAYLRSTA
jgi:DNA-binding NarL/FixJ family response regulator